MTIEKNQEILKKYYVADIDTKTIDEDNRIVNVIVSSEVVDRDGDVIKVAGINLKNYKKNPTVLWCHNSYEPAIAKALEIIKTDTQLLATAQFAETPEALKIWSLVKDGYVKAVSIGFMITESRFANKHDKEVYTEKTNRVINKAEMFEFSFVNIPANTDAIVTAVHKGLITKEIAKEYFEIEIEAEQIEEDIVEEIKEEVEIIEKKKTDKTYNIEINNNTKYTKQKYNIEILRKKGQIIIK